jgi:hypothetical protein
MEIKYRFYLCFSFKQRLVARSNKFILREWVLSIFDAIYPIPMSSILKKILLAVLIPVAFALFTRLLFGTAGLTLWGVMTIAFIFFVPFAMGALTIYFSNIENVKSRGYRIAMPWIPVIIFMIITIFFTIEGWACWVMILPLFMLAASVGGLIAGHFKLNKHRRENLNICLLIFLPLLLSPLEQQIAKIPGRYKADTHIDIHASKEDIWSNVTRVSEISTSQDKGWFTRFLGFPRPIKAELNYEGLGAYRKAIFDKGLVFDETVTEYEHERKMTFTIKANPYEIPSTTMDEHVVIGGEYFDVLNGTYELEQLDNETYRLHLFSYFKLTTTFNFYASWWAGWIMKDIQNNILQIVKERAEHGPQN